MFLVTQCNSTANGTRIHWELGFFFFSLFKVQLESLLHLIIAGNEQKRGGRKGKSHQLYPTTETLIESCSSQHFRRELDKKESERRAPAPAKTRFASKTARLLQEPSISSRIYACHPPHDFTFLHFLGICTSLLLIPSLNHFSFTSDTPLFPQK